jgi:hypothetical protein
MTQCFAASRLQNVVFAEGEKSDSLIYTLFDIAFGKKSFLLIILSLKP